MIRSNVLLVLVLFAVLATLGCASGTTGADEDVTSAPPTNDDADVDERNNEIQGAPNVPILSLSQGMHSAEQLQYGPFPLPWNPKQK